MYIEEQKIKDFILDAGLLSREEIEFAQKQSEESNHNLSDYLVSEGKLSEDEIKKIQAYILGIPFISVGDQKIPKDILSIIPEPIARKHNIVAYKSENSVLEVAMLDTDDLSAIDFIRKKSGFKIAPRLTSSDSLRKALLQYQKSLIADFGDLIKNQTDQIEKLSNDFSNRQAGNTGIRSASIEKIAEELPVIKIVDTLLKHAVLQGASDVHIEPAENNLIIRYRVDGILYDAMKLPKNAGPAIIARIKVLSSLKLDEKRLPQDGRFKLDLEGEKVSFRVSVLPVYYGEKAVMRILREGGGGFTLESLGFHGDGLEKVHEALKQKTGLILATGPTGSGKSTTLYTLMDLLNEPSVNISTIEDPIEYQMPRINQTQVNSEIGFTFSEGLRSLIRQDPDVIMVGEIRDGETAGLAVNSALTGHLVLSTLHTNSAAGTIARLINMGAQPFLLTSTLKVIIGQRLVRKLAKKEKYYLKKPGIKQLEKIANLKKVMHHLVKEGILKEETPWEKVPFYKAAEIEEVDGSEGSDAYEGRIGIHEVLNVNEAVKDLIMKEADVSQIEKEAKDEGMLTMIEDGIFKVVQGKTSIEEIFRVVSE